MLRESDFIVLNAVILILLLFSSLGKSGLVACRMAASLSSLGIPAHFVHATEWAHGDLGKFRVYIDMNQIWHDLYINQSLQGFN